MPVEKELTVENVVNTEDLISTLENITVRNVLHAVIAAAVMLLLTRVVMVLLKRGLSKTHADEYIRRLIQGIVKGLLLFVTVIAALGCLGISVTSLVAVLSVVGLALSLALQNFLENVAGGFQIFASHPFKPGDWIEVDGTVGQVAEIGMFYTKLKGIDNRLIQFPNSAVVSGTIINYTHEELRRVEVKVKASYNSDPALVLKTLREMLTGHPLALLDPEPFVHVFAYQENDILYIARVWCKNADYWTIYFDLMDNMKAAFNQAGIEISYPHVNVHMIGGGPQSDDK